jgi:hypothetical protein
MKQTAVEWLVRKINNELIGEIPMNRWDEIREIVQQALAMEKEQIVDAFDSGQMEEAKQEFWTKGYKYYNETYGTSKNVS